MLSFAKNGLGMRLAAASILLLPMVALICAMSHSEALQTVVLFVYAIFALVSITGAMLEISEENKAQ